MVTNITAKINAKYFLYLYNHKHLAPRTISKSILLIYKNVNSDDLYTKFIFYIYFNDVCREIQCPNSLSHVSTSPVLIKYIRDRLFDEIHTNKFDVGMLIKLFRKQEGTSYKEISSNEALNVFCFLLRLEKNIPDLVFSEFEYFSFICKKIDYKEKIRMLNSTQMISPILLVLILSIKETDIPKHHLGIYYLVDTLDKSTIEGMRLMDNKNVDHTALENTLIYNENKIISKLYEKFLILYPEIKYSSYKHPNRIFFFENPLKISLDVKTLKVYVPAVLDYIKINTPHLRNTPIDVLLRVIYIERILKSQTTKKEYRLIHSFIVDSSQIITVLLRRKFSNSHISKMVRYVPSMFIGFDLALKMFVKTNDSFYLNLIRSLLSKYPTRDNLKKVLDHISFFPASLSIDFQKLIDHYKQNV